MTPLRTRLVGPVSGIQPNHRANQTDSRPDYDSSMRFKAGEIIDYRQMCDQENASLQRGMNFRLNPGHSVVLMSVRSGAPYDDEIRQNGQVLIYEGHNVPKTASNPIPGIKDQELTTTNGSLTENGKFFEAASQYKSGSRSAEIVRVYEKIRSGIWAYAGTFELLDAWAKQSGGRRVFKFKLKLVAVSGTEEHSTNNDNGPPDLVHNRIIPSAVKQAVWKRDQGKCVTCESRDNLHFDHILPFSKGGASVLVENIQLLCARHNLEKSDKLI